MLKELLPIEIYNAIEDCENINEISEIRLRVDKPLVYLSNGIYHTLYVDGEIFMTNKFHIENVLAGATGRSLYAYNDQIARGFLSYKGGIRIGLAGECVEDNGKIVTFKNISYLVIRIPKEYKGVADNLMTMTKGKCTNILIISPPCQGKTTFLRDYVRQISNLENNVLLIDERNEVSATSKGKPALDVGNFTDVISYSNKKDAYKMAIRSLAPNIIATDEVCGKEEIEGILDIIRAGINVVATIHAKDIDSFKDNEYFKLIKYFNWAVLLDRHDGVFNSEVLALNE